MIRENEMMFGTLYDQSGPGTSTSSKFAAMSLVPVPDRGMGAGSEGNRDEVTLEDGRAEVVGARAMHRVFEMEWGVREALGAEGLNIIKNYAEGVYGPGLIYFADPMNYTSNLLPPNVAAPALGDVGWRPFFDASSGSYDPVPSNAYRHPPFSATWTISTSTVDQRDICVIPVHPDMTLHIGFSGSATGAGVVRVRPINLDGSYASVTNLTLLNYAASTRLNASFSGSTYKAVEVYVTRSSAVAASVTLVSGMAQLWPTTDTPTLTGSWISGQGNWGCKFSGGAVPETYIMAAGGRSLKGLSVRLVEVGNSTRYYM